MNTPLPPEAAAKFLKRLMEVQWRKPGVGNALHPTSWGIAGDGLVVYDEHDEDEDED